MATNKRYLDRIKAWYTPKSVPKVTRKCTYQGCKQPHKAGGYCAKHYARDKAGKLFKADAMTKLVKDGEQHLQQRIERALDRPCEVCGCPRSYGNCNLCHPLPASFVSLPAVLVVACDDEIYSGMLWSKPKTRRTRRIKYPFSGRSIPREMW